MTLAPVWADHAATSPPRPEVIEAVTRTLAEAWGNPSSHHQPQGRRAQVVLDEARAQVSALIGARRPEEILFCSSATEAINLAIKGVVARLLHRRPRLISISTEHAAVREALAACARAGAELVELPVDAAGRVDPAQLAAAVDDRCALICAMLVNNESGLIHPVTEFAAIAHAHGALLLCDATQAPLRLPVDAQVLGCDLLTLSAHKLGGPPGAGALWLRSGLALEPLLHGGGQERGLRSGTEALPAIAGFGAAAAATLAEGPALHARLASLTAQLEDELRSALPGLRIHAAEASRAPGISLLTLPGLPRGWLAQMGAIAVSGGSACAGNRGSAVLRALGAPEDEALNALRISFGWNSSSAESTAAVQATGDGARRLQASGTLVHPGTLPRRQES